MQDILERQNVSCAVKEFFSGKQLAESPETFDLVLLDIMMEQTDGVTAADILRKRGGDFVLIFITSSKEYMQDAFDVEAFQYLIKPVEPARLERALSAALKKLAPPRNRRLIYTKNGRHGKVDLNATSYFESIGRVIKIHQPDKPVVEYYEQFDALESRLTGNDFFRCHKSYLVNLSYVAHYDKTDITLDDGTRIPLAKRRYREFARAMLHYLKKVGGIL